MFVATLRVLILVLMEDTLREAAIARFGIIIKVLILVLMEDTLREGLNNLTLAERCLNPCFNGRYSQSKKIKL